jgi:hypothetical protein
MALSKRTDDADLALTIRTTFSEDQHFLWKAASFKATPVNIGDVPETLCADSPE